MFNKMKLILPTYVLHILQDQVSGFHFLHVLQEQVSGFHTLIILTNFCKDPQLLIFSKIMAIY